MERQTQGVFRHSNKTAMRESKGTFKNKGQYINSILEWYFITGRASPGYHINKYEKGRFLDTGKIVEKCGKDSYIVKLSNGRLVKKRHYDLKGMLGVDVKIR